ncbi:hypothetical protein MmiEs2_04960 [Methanimicrococcus stummii]|uniref:Uncharacterized protein n=1 Tax=Methanimicrococcus stummii TaxID=3028294 RepID=A0AA96ZXZ7_9EURY|nr:hypothetical protein [Methanimicrococcus sp. Es2]WNY28311.1 hypothetical protein MmiEs2_04960 [Methanimicrococcus sp. Es2]
MTEPITPEQLAEYNELRQEHGAKVSKMDYLNGSIREDEESVKIIQTRIKAQKAELKKLEKEVPALGEKLKTFKMNSW